MKQTIGLTNRWHSRDIRTPCETSSVVELAVGGCRIENGWQSRDAYNAPHCYQTRSAFGQIASLYTTRYPRQYPHLHYDYGPGNHGNRECFNCDYTQNNLNMKYVSAQEFGAWTDRSNVYWSGGLGSGPLAVSGQFATPRNGAFDRSRRAVNCGKRKNSKHFMKTRKQFYWINPSLQSNACKSNTPSSQYCQRHGKVGKTCKIENEEVFVNILHSESEEEQSSCYIQPRQFACRGHSPNTGYLKTSVFDRSRRLADDTVKLLFVALSEVQKLRRQLHPKCLPKTMQFDSGCTVNSNWYLDHGSY